MATKKAAPKKAAVNAPAKTPAKAPVQAVTPKKAPAKRKPVTNPERVGTALTDAHAQIAGSVAETMALVGTLKARLTNVLGIYTTPKGFSNVTGDGDDATALNIDRDVRAVNSQLQALIDALIL